jgi:hypothetical protein
MQISSVDCRLLLTAVLAGVGRQHAVPRRPDDTSTPEQLAEMASLHQCDADPDGDPAHPSG